MGEEKRRRGKKKKVCLLWPWFHVQQRSDHLCLEEERDGDLVTTNPTDMIDAFNNLWLLF